MAHRKVAYAPRIRPVAALLALLLAAPAVVAAASAVPTAAAPAAAPAATTAPSATGSVPVAADPTPYRFRTVEGAGGVPLNVVSVGDPKNPPILLIHGLAQSYLAFEPQFRSALAERFHLVAFDLRGHGNSGKPWERTAYSDAKTWGEDVARVVAALELKRPVILGWSYGTLVAVDYLRTAGADAVAGLVTTGAYGGLTPPPPMTALPPEFVRIRERQLAPDLEQNYAAARATAPRLTAKPMPQAWLDRTVAIALMLPRAAREGMFMRPLDSRDLLPRLQALPALIVVGGKDTSTPEATARELAKQLPKSRVSVYPEDGHSPFLESPERFNRELLEFALAAHGLKP